MEIPVSRIPVFSQPSIFRRFAVAILASIIATALQFYLNPLLRHQTPFLFHALAVAVSAAYGGTIPGLTTTFLSLFLAQVLFVAPLMGSRISNPSDIPGLLVVSCVGIFLSFFFGRRRRAEEEVLRVRYNLEAAQHIANIGRWESDLVTGALWWSAETRNIFGVQVDKALTKEDFYRFAHPEDRDRVRELATTAIKSKGQYNVEHRIVRSDGEVRYVHQIAKVLCDNRRAPIRMIGSIQDITDRKRAEQEIRMLRGLLPICSHCKKIRDDKTDGSWFEIETYVTHHSEANFSHSICPECMKRFYEP